MVKLGETNLDVKSTKLFLLLSVVLLDMFMAYGIWICSRALKMDEKSKGRLALFILTNAGQYFIDYMNLHYSGIFIGILLASFGYMLMNKYFKSAALFVLAINLNQTCLFLSPAYFTYLFTSYCDPWKQSPKDCVYNFSCLALIVIAGFAPAFAPFIWFGQLTQVLQRIFPFERGIVNKIVFAPNFWVLHPLVDVFLGANSEQLDHSSKTLMDSNCVGIKQTVLTTLSRLTPMMTQFITFGMLVPVLVKLWKSAKKPRKFLQAVILCSYTCFFFGW